MIVSKSKHPRYPWRVKWKEGVVSKNRFFESEKAARQFAGRKKTEIVDIAPSDIPPDAAERRALQEARVHGVPLMEAITHWRRTAGAAQGKTVSDLIDARLFAAMNERISPHYERSVIRELERAREAFGDLPAISLTPEKCHQYLQGAPGHYSQKLSRAIFGSVFTHAISLGWLAVNPVVKFRPVKRNNKDDVDILSVEDAARWLCCVAAHAPDCLAGCAIAIFAGLRTAEVQRLEWQEVDMERALICVTRGKSKTKTRRLVDIMGNLAAILEPLAQKAGKIYPHSPERALKKAKRAYGKRLPKNVARHCFVSYHLGLFNDLALTEMQAGHEKESLFQHYRALVTQGAAESFFSITVENLPPAA